MIAEIVCSILLLQEGGQEKPTVAPAESAAAEQGLFGMPLHGFVSTKYRFRSTDEFGDQDLYQFLSLDYGNPERDRWTAHLFIRATEDLDGYESGHDPFNDITATYNRFNARFYYGYVDIHRLGPVETLRVGRQFEYETPLTFHFDGISAETVPCKEFLQLKAGLYGGIPVHLYEDSMRNDYILGGYVHANPWTGGRARVDYVRVQDEYLLGVAISDFFGFGLWQSLGERILVQAQYNLLDGKSRDLLLRGNYYDPSWDLRVDLSYYQLLTTQPNVAIDMDFFFTSVQEYHPYGQLRLLAAKGFGEHFVLQAGTDIRELYDEGDEGLFNREFRRFYVTPMVNNWPLQGLSASVTGEIWDVPGSENGDFMTLGFDVTHKLSDQFKFSVGSAYAAYKYDFLLNLENEDVRTIYVRAAYAHTKQLKFQGSYEFEDTDGTDFQTLKIGVGYSF